MKSFAAILLLVVITCGIQASEPVKSEAAQQLMQLLNQVNGHQTL
jgi:mannan endo-1,4-beta-mannosidase